LTSSREKGHLLGAVTRTGNEKRKKKIKEIRLFFGLGHRGGGVVKKGKGSIVRGHISDP